MNQRGFSYEQDDFLSQVDEIYSRDDVREQMRALSMITRERVTLSRTRVIRVHTIMNPLVAELFGERGKHDHLNEYISQSRLLNNNTATED